MDILLKKLRSWVVLRVCGRCIEEEKDTESLVCVVFENWQRENNLCRKIIMSRVTQKNEMM